MGELVVFVALAHVADPGSEVDGGVVEGFGVGGGDVCVAFACDVLLECLDVLVESGGVVHGVEFSVEPRVVGLVLGVCIVFL